MRGKVLEYDEENSMGYIKGFDEIIYFFHAEHIMDNEEVNENDIVEFDYLLRGNGDLPYAIEIKKKKYGTDKNDVSNVLQKGQLNEWTTQEKAYRELYEILKHIPEEEKMKIPKGFLKYIEENMAKGYIYKVNIKEFENQEMLEETRALLAILYRDYWATEEKRKEILTKEKEQFEQIKLEKAQKYDVTALTDLFPE